MRNTQVDRPSLPYSNSFVICDQIVTSLHLLILTTKSHHQASLPTTTVQLRIRCKHGVFFEPRRKSSNSSCQLSKPQKRHATRSTVILVQTCPNTSTLQSGSDPTKEQLLTNLRRMGDSELEAYCNKLHAEIDEVRTLSNKVRTISDQVGIEINEVKTLSDEVRTDLTQLRAFAGDIRTVFNELQVFSSDVRTVFNELNQVLPAQDSRAKALLEQEAKLFKKISELEATEKSLRLAQLSDTVADAEV